MSELQEREEGQIVDLDTCPKGKSILVGAAITAILSIASFGIPSLGLPYILGGFAAAGHFAVRHKITIKAWQGIKLGIIACLLGGLVGLVRPVIQLMSMTEADWKEQADMLSQDAYESGMPEFADAIQELYTAENIPLFLGGMLIIVLVSGVVLGTLGGLLGSAFLKKGPLAQ